MRSGSVLRAALGAALATLLLVSTTASCSSTAGRTAGAVALTAPTATARPAATTTPRPTPTTPPTPPTTPLNLGCGPSVQPVPYVIRSGPAKHYVALTFDDGPSPDYTHIMLATLEQTHTPATFFVVGASVQKYPALVQREAGDGFAIGIHTWDHPFMTQLTPAQREWELSKTVQALHHVLGAHYCVPFWRPPFGDYNQAVVAQARSMGLSTVTWDVDPRDWSAPGVHVIVNRVLAAVHPGAIILLHDGYFFRQQTAQALPLIIKGLKKRGYVPVTLPVLLAGGP